MASSMPWVTIRTVSVSLSLLPQVDELLLQPGPGERVEGAEGLVEQQHPGLDGEGPGDGGALLHAAGDLVRASCPCAPTARRR